MLGTIYWSISSNTLYIGQGGNTWVQTSPTEDPPWLALSSQYTYIQCGGGLEDNPKPKYMYRWFYNLTGKQLDISGIDTSECETFERCFYMESGRASSGGTILDLTSWVITNKCTNLLGMFWNNTYQQIKLNTNNDYSNVTTYLGMFACNNEGTSNLTTITGIDNLVKSSATNLSAMFQQCNVLTELDVENWDTINVTNMQNMFSGCKALRTLNGIGNWNVEKVENMKTMFQHCERCTWLHKIYTWKTSALKYADHMFNTYSSFLTEIDIGNFDTSHLETCTMMFANNPQLQYIYVGKNWNVSNISSTNSADMFYNSSLIRGDVSSNWSSSDQHDKTYAKLDGGENDKGYLSYSYNISGLISAYNDSTRDLLIAYHEEGATLPSGYYFGIGNGTRNVTVMTRMYGKTLAQTITIDSNVENNDCDIVSMAHWFEHLQNVTAINNIENLNEVSRNSLSFEYTFSDMVNLASIDFSNFNTENATNFHGFISGAKALTELDISHLNTSNATNMSTMFALNNYTELDVTTLDTHNVVDFMGMFNGCTELLSLDLSNFNTSKAENMYFMFGGCSSLTELDLSSFDTRNVTNMQEMCRLGYEGRQSVCTFIDVHTFDTKKVTNMQGMFGRLDAMESLDIANFEINSLTNTSIMFADSPSLKKIYTKPDVNWNIPQITLSVDMFRGCTSLVGENGTTFSSSHTTKEYARTDKSGQAGYFSNARRTITADIEGSGVVNGLGTYLYGTTVNLSFVPNINQYQYLNKVEKTIDGVTTLVTDTHTQNPFYYSIALTRNVDLGVIFALRQQHQLNASDEEYVIQGAGTYRYLDNPTLLAKLYGLIQFGGWYEDDELLSTTNPYTFEMPDRDLTLRIEAGANPFTNMKVRQFVLQNGNGEVYRLTNKASNIFLNNPKGLGFAKKITSTRIGNKLSKNSQEFTMPTVSGSLVFHGKDLAEIYKDYNEFVNFISVEPVRLWYKIPTPISPTLETNIYYLDIEATSLEKTEVKENGVMECNFVFTGTSFYKYEEAVVSGEDEEIRVFNNADFDVGVNLVCTKLDGLPFTNPIIRFKDINTYGAVAFLGTYTQIELDTKDGEQNIKLYNGNSVITNPFAYLNDTIADGEIIFPFPKLKQGYTNISFTYDNDEEEVKSYLLSYDKEYLSV